MIHDFLQSIEWWFAQPVVESLGWALVHFMWQGAVVALLLAVLLRSLRKASANTRYVIGCLALLLMAVCPLGTLVFSNSRAERPLDLQQQANERSSINSTSIEKTTALNAAPPVPDAVRAEVVPSSVPSLSVSAPTPPRLALRVVRPLLPWFVAVWLIGVLVLSVRLGAGWLWIQQMRRRRVRPVPSDWEAKLQQLAERMRVWSPVRLLESTLVEVPVVIGWLRPVVLLPASCLVGLLPRELEAILAHELAHVRRHDYLVNLLQTAIETLLFYHPGVWWVSRNIRAEREACCDDIATQVCGNRLEYARALTSLEELRARPPQLVVAACDGPLLNRIRRLIGFPVPATNRSAWWVIAAIAAAVLAVLAVNSSNEAPAHASEGNPPITASDKVTPNQPPKTAGTATAVATGEPDPSALEEGIVTGIVVKASDGTPISEAHVILRSGQKHEAKTDADGRFRFEKIPPNPYGYEIWAYQANLVTPKTAVRQLQASNSASGKFAPLRLEMVEGHQAKFVVTSKMNGRPISGAVVRFGYPDRRKVETDNEGSAVVMGLLPEAYDVTIEADGHARATPQIDLAQAESVLEYKIALGPGGTVTGVVVDAEGKPVPEADVVYREPNGTGYYGDAYRTDAAGHFRHRFLPLNKPIEVSVHKDKYLDEKKDIVLTTSQHDLDLPITLAKRPKGGSVTGTVIDQSGRPVVGAKVANYTNRPDPDAMTTTDAQGQFLLDDLAAGFTGFEIIVTAKGYAPQRESVQPGTIDHPGVVSVKLTQGHAIHGQIVDEQGNPMPQAFVSVRSEAYPLGGLGSTVRTDKEGQFAFDSLPAEARFDVNMPSYPHLFNIPLKLDGDDPVTVKLDSPGIIRGVVVDGGTGQPVPQFQVRLSWSRVRQPNDPQGTFSSELEQGVTFKSSAGQFAIAPLTLGLAVELTIEAEGYERSVVPRAVAAKADKADNLKIALKRAEAVSRFTLSGQLLGYDGKPAPSAQLRLIVSPSPPLGMNDNDFNWVLIKNGQLAGKVYCEQFLSLATDAQGRFEFQNILPGKYLQLAYWGDGVPQGRSLAFDKTQPGKTEAVTIRLPEPAVVQGKIDRSKFPEIGPIQLSRNQEAWHHYEITLKEDQGSFEFRDLPPGDYGIVVLGKPVRFSENGQAYFRTSALAGQQFRLAAGDTKEISFTEPDKPK